MAKIVTRTTALVKNPRSGYLEHGWIDWLKNDVITAVEALHGLNVGEPRDKVMYLAGYCAGKADLIEEHLARFGIVIIKRGNGDDN